MEYSIYINQKAAMAWDLSMAESILFSFLISSCGWMASLEEDGRYKWASNSKLAEELPLVCAHQGSARRHMRALEEKSLIDRRVVGNRSYFRITEKGLLWKSDTLPRANETAHPDAQGERNGSAKANETVRPRVNQMVRQSDTPSLSDKPISKTDRRSMKKPLKEKYTPPVWIPSEQWSDYLDSRRDKKHPMTAGALKLCVQAIENTVSSGVSVHDVMNRMIEAGWRTVKPDWFRDSSPSGGSNSAGNAELAEKMRARMAAGMLQ